MSFFKSSSGVVSNKAVVCLQGLIWVLIYGGLLTLVLGLSVQRINDDLGGSLEVWGGLVAVLGFILIYVRSKMKVE